MKKDQLILLIILIPSAIIMLFVTRALSPDKTKLHLAINNPSPAASYQSNQFITIDQATLLQSRNIEIIYPLIGDSVKPGFVVKGNARTFESIVNLKLLDSSGNILSESAVTANAPAIGQFGPFEKVINFQTSDISGELQVFQFNLETGAEIDKVTIPLVFSK